MNLDRLDYVGRCAICGKLTLLASADPSCLTETAAAVAKAIKHGDKIEMMSVKDIKACSDEWCDGHRAQERLL